MATEDVGRWHERARKADAHSRATGVRVWTVTTPAAPAFDARLCALAWWGTVLWGFDGFGWGEPAFSAPTSILPRRECEARAGLPEASFTSRVLRSGLRFTRKTRQGVVEIDFERGEGRYVRTQSGVRVPITLEESFLSEVRQRPRPAAHPRSARRAGSKISEVSASAMRRDRAAAPRRRMTDSFADPPVSVATSAAPQHRSMTAYGNASDTLAMATTVAC